MGLGVRTRNAIALALAAAAFSSCREAKKQELPPAPAFDMAPLTPGVRGQLRSLTAEFNSRPDDGAANLNLAKALVAYESFSAAEGYLLRAAILDPKDYAAAYLLGWMRATVGDRDRKSTRLNSSHT